ncbi:MULTISPECIES: phosphoethanolamine--lipid A transferase [unclassified Ensifer]|uniref:phosphoethanolamine transferase n=1 Tax=unclassified Ensifer TaxID=2633371 RepID=UPI000713C934|nr:MULTISPECIES: phosphoethanolamine--lipid A transferase [unclassified Ensifer]KQX16266.1 sulfatase [Ensifer sp. Root423]KQZ41327.1 sulfatase [Ensifer sp. Root558]SFG52663.1 lipid A ethanolaminephosphotransferase [Ensifer sp. OV372]
MRFSGIRRPEIGSIALSALVSAYLLLATNKSFWTHTVAYFDDSLTARLSFSAALCLLTFAGLTLASVKYVMKPVMIFLIMVSAAASYFIDTFGVIIDKDMIGNAAVTTQAEASHLLTGSLATHLLLYGVLPSLLVIWFKLRYRPFLSNAAVNLAVIIPCLLVSGGLVYANFANVAYVIREHKDLMKRFNPTGPVSAAVRYASSTYKQRNIVVQPLATDARQGARIEAAGKPVVVVVVAGETARAMNFSLNGYGRETNPELKALGVVNYTDTTSCGTATATSLPCMFSVYPRDEYSDWKARSTENLMNVLTRAGVSTTWWDNNTGSKGIADLINFASMTDQKNSPLCKNGECLDEIFLGELDKKLSATKKNSVIVLHQLGSHGPSYYLRYPEKFRRFTPDCRTAELMKCSVEEITNAYDNTILYTDYVVASVARLLEKHQDQIAGAMIYMSDHGESLGENGIYLHGAPYAIAPREQTQVPFIAWFSKPYQAAMGVDTACLAKDTAQPKSHDNLFHTVLGMMNVETKVYKPGLDAFASCTKKPGGGSAFQAADTTNDLPASPVRSSGFPGAL